jgi:hypothetical protein
MLHLRPPQTQSPFGPIPQDSAITHHVRSLEAKTAFHEADDLVKVPITLVQGQQRRKLLGVDNEVETTDLRETELLLVHTRRVDLLPDPASR